MDWFNNLKIGKKILFSFILISAITAFVGLKGLSSMKAMNSMLDTLYQDELEGISFLKEADINLINSSRAERNLLLASTPEERQHFREAIERYDGLLEENLSKAEPLIQSDQGKKNLAELKKAFATYKEISDEVVAKAMADQLNQSKDYIVLAQTEGRKQADLLDTLMERLSRRKENDGKAFYEESGAVYADQRMYMIILILGSLGLGLGLGIFISRNISSPIKQITYVASKIARGEINMEVSYRGKDEIGQLADSFREMSDVLKEKAQAAEQISQGNYEIDMKAVSEEDVLGKAMIEMRDALRSNEQARQEGDRLAKKVTDFQDNEVNKLREALDKLSRGDMDIRLEVAEGDKDTAQVRELFRVVNAAVNKVLETIQELIDETGQLIHWAKEGALAKRGDYQKFHGGYRQLVQGINEILDAVVEPINEAVQNLESMAEGDLTVNVEGDYRGDHARMKMALNTTIDSLNDILGQVAVAVEQVASGSRQVSDSSQGVSQGATEQASSLEEITSSMTEMSSQSRQNAENAAQANKLTNASQNAAKEGNGRMQQMLKAMGDINDSSGQISKIIKVIDEIAFQTNLLALNAAVEAARAGVHGKGFAVVAEEVRNLAQRSAKAAKETTELIEGSVENVKNGTKIADETAKALEEIINGITKASDLVDEIASASREQVQGMEQVSQAMDQIDQVTQSNTANAEEGASAAEELSSQAMQLKEVLSRFRLKQHSTRKWKESRFEEEADYAPKPIVTGSWGNANGNGKNRKNGNGSSNGNGKGIKLSHGSPSDIIALDDDEFGDF